ncbi:MAG TPA: potassium channel family protein [Thermomicrobiales bacterium]|nr:potassium channel family protein [Thermomicrobiales bacterium]
MTDRSTLTGSQAGSDSRTTSMYELFIGLLTIISLVVMALLLLLRIAVPDSPIIGVLFATDTLFCVIFLFDFGKNLLRADSKRDYLFWHGILDLLGSIPSIPALRLARVARVFRVARLLTERGMHGLAREIVQRRAEGALYLTSLLALLMLIIGSCLVLAFEAGIEDSNITTGRDAFWWAYVTITTVGYGDRFPVSNGGRVIGLALMTVGIGIFGVLTSFMSSVLLAPPKDKQPSPESESTGSGHLGEHAEFEALRSELAGLRSELAETRALLRDLQAI